MASNLPLPKMNAVIAGAIVTMVGLGAWEFFGRDLVINVKNRVFG